MLFLHIHKLIAQFLLFSSIPNIPAGDYLLRAEIIGLHEADALYSQNSARGAQFYPRYVS
jgi:hypothetical protein